MTHGYVKKVGRNWHMWVVDKTGKVIVTDNSGPGSRIKITEEAAEVVSAVRRIEQIGHVLEKPWDQLVDEAGDF
jgi:hypothetical protein